MTVSVVLLAAAVAAKGNSRFPADARGEKHPVRHRIEAARRGTCPA